MKTAFALALVLAACHTGEKRGTPEASDPLVGGWVAGADASLCFRAETVHGAFCSDAPDAACAWRRESENLVSVDTGSGTETVQVDETDGGIAIVWHADGVVPPLYAHAEPGACP